MGVRIPLAIRFWRHVEKRGADECWIWTASTDTHGYGHLKLDGKVVLAHRVSWALANNTVLPDLWVLHKCDNPPCVNPAHLFLGTRTDNVRDMLAKGRRPPVRLIGERNPMAKLSESDIPIIRRRVASGDRRADVAIAYQVSDATIDLIVARKRWASVE